MDERRKIIEKIFEIFFALRHKVDARMRLLFEEQQITHSQWFVLHIIEKKESMNIKDLAVLLGITSSAVTQVVDGLVKRGLLLRKRKPDDRRVLIVTLTQKSRSKFNSIKNKRIDAISSLFDAVDDCELKRFYEIMDKIVKKIG